MGYPLLAMVANPSFSSGKVSLPILRNSEVISHCEVLPYLNLCQRLKFEPQFFGPPRPADLTSVKWLPGASKLPRGLCYSLYLTSSKLKAKYNDFDLVESRVPSSILISKAGT
jgi:hypothetical protein